MNKLRILNKFLGKFGAEAVRKADLKPKGKEPYNLDKKHVEEAELLVDRTELLKSLPDNAEIAELGVDQGDFSRTILDITNPKKLYLVDIWGSDRYDDSKHDKVRGRFSQEIAAGKIDIERMRSEKFLQELEDEILDVVYIDTTHSYQQTKKELNLSADKVKEKGLICGHDYCKGNLEGLVRYDVIKAVHEFCREKEYNLEYLTIEGQGHRSFALKKA